MSETLTRPESASAGDTKTVLLEVGTRCFARKGYQATSVREICSEAGANVAALNYHFGGKFEFYKAVLFHAFERQHDTGWPPPSLAEAPEDPEGQLHQYIRWFVTRMLRSKGDTTVRDLVHHELREPTGALDVLVDTTMKPANRAMSDIVAAVAGGSLTAGALMSCCISIMGQCLVYKQCLPMLERIYGPEHFTPGHVDDIADHVFRYALAGIRAVAASGEAAA